MGNDADVPGDLNPSGDNQVDRAAPGTTPSDSGANESSLSNDAARSVADRQAVSRRDLARQQRALRRAYHNRKLPSWMKYIPWVVFPVYGFMRLADPNYEEHFTQWQEEQRRNYLETESR